MRTQIILMVGLPGSGKSTAVDGALRQAEMLDLNATSVSADEWFARSGEYVFDPAQLPQAHAWCQGKVEGFLAAGNADVIYVDNTNLTGWERAPYIKLAQTYGAEVRTVVMEARAEECAERNIHGVGLEAIERMAARQDHFASDDCVLVR